MARWLVPKVFVSPPYESAIFLTAGRGWLFPLHSFSSQTIIPRSRHLPKFWSKKPINSILLQLDGNELKRISGWKSKKEIAFYFPAIHELVFRMILNKGNFLLSFFKNGRISCGQNESLSATKLIHFQVRSKSYTYNFFWRYYITH